MTDIFGDLGTTILSSQRLPKRNPSFPTIDNNAIFRISANHIIVVDESSGIRTFQLFHPGELYHCILADGQIRECTTATEYWKLVLPASYVYLATAFNAKARPDGFRFAHYDSNTGLLVKDGIPMQRAPWHLSDQQCGLEPTTSTQGLSGNSELVQVANEAIAQQYQRLKRKDDRRREEMERRKHTKDLKKATRALLDFKVVPEVTTTSQRAAKRQRRPKALMSTIVPMQGIASTSAPLRSGTPMPDILASHSLTDVHLPAEPSASTSASASGSTST
ncbi:hypothetical protein CVT26_005295 [Gymnopilus dilepis]|uniref:Uncharacterized protein n=1 Tax=Gymnopilus dilepis TaxID=231916 RepID=A0A409YSZ1_9AGAR|nr:hypothetical protein CVT26_005295 [Gymnopilus dilepis]